MIGLRRVAQLVFLLSYVVVEAVAPAQSALSYQVVFPGDGHIINVRFGVDSNKTYNLVFTPGAPAADQAYVLSLPQFNNFGYSGVSPSVSFGNTVRPSAAGSTFPQAETLFLNNQLYAHFGSGKAPSQQMYTTYNVGGSVVRNPAPWVGAAVDYSAISVYSSSSQEFNPVLLSPMHAAVAKHVDPGVGTALTWLDSKGALFTRTVVEQTTIVDPGTGNPTDLDLLTLDSPVPSTVLPMKLMPADWATNPVYGVWQSLPAVQFELSNRMIGTIGTSTDTSLDGLPDQSVPLYTSYATTAPVVSPATVFYLQLQGGDSSSPYCFINPSSNPPELALVGLASLVFFGTDAAFYTPQIQAAMDADFQAGRTPVRYFVQTSNFSVYN